MFARQQRLRLAAARPELAEPFAELDSVSRRLATLALAGPGPQQQAAYRRQIDDLSEQKEQLERTLEARSAEFRNAQKLRQLLPAELQVVLPPETALVDFLEYRAAPPPAKGKKKQPGEQRLVAFVVRPHTLERVELGPAKPIMTAVDEWLVVLTDKDGTKTDTGQAGRLRRLLWQPLTKHFQGVSTVLVSPDGALGRLPWAALPGSHPTHYLLEEVRIGVLPVPQLVPELMAKGQGQAKVEPSLLLVGGVDYGASPGAMIAAIDRRSAARGSRPGVLKAFDPLPATLPEVLTVGHFFTQRFSRKPTELLGEQPTEEAVRRQAPKHTYLHLVPCPCCFGGLFSGTLLSDGRKGIPFSEKDLGDE